MDETDRSQVAFDMRPISGIGYFGPAPGFANTPRDIQDDMGKPVGGSSTFNLRSPSLSGLTALLVVVVMLQHYAPIRSIS